MRNLTLVFLLVAHLFAYAQDKPLRVGIAGLTHGHVHWVLRSVSEGTLILAGIAEPNKDLAGRLMKQYNLDASLLYDDFASMVDKTKPEAVVAFGSIYDHLNVVKVCAPRKVHVMVEKPLAVSLAHAREMELLAKKHGIHLLTNYETTWYGSHHVAYEMLQTDSRLGAIVKVVVHDGHQGPKEIGVNQEFLEWLTDPGLNGGGALMDFGCYGADLVTWLMRGERPQSVFAVTQQIKPHVYPKVDDEATIVVTYPKTQAIIQASWNWPYSRKDIEIYTASGYIMADRQGMRFMTDAKEGEQSRKIPPRQAPYNDPFLFLTGVVRGKIEVEENDLSGLSVNLTAMEILEAAKQSAAAGKAVHFTK